MNYYPIDKYIAISIKNARIGNHITMQELANKLGITRSTYCRYEHAERSIPSNTFRNLCKYLKLNDIVILREAQEYMIKCFSKGLDD